MSDLTVEERRWAIAIENAAFGVWDLDVRRDSVHYSPQWKARLGFPRIEAPDNIAFWRCRVHPDDVDPMLGSLRSHMEGCSPTYEMRFRLRSNGSGYRTMLSRGRIVARDSSGNAVRMVGTMFDLKGWPASMANYGLAAEAPAPTQESTRFPFHAALGARHHLGENKTTAVAASGEAGRASLRDTDRLAELVADLLDRALHDVDAAR